MRVVLYKRLSPTGESKEQIEEKFAEQERKGRDHCREAGKEIVSVFEDKLVSGRKKEPMEREGFWDMMQYIAENPIDEIVVSKKNRLTRIAVIGVDLPQYIAAVQKALSGKYWKPDIYAVEEGEYVKELVDLDEASAGDLFGEFANFHGDQDSAHSDARSTQLTITNRQAEYRPTGKSPAAINSNRVVLGEEKSYYYLPEDDREFERAIGILNTLAHSNGMSNYEIGKEHGFKDNPGIKTDAIERNAWKFYQAYHAARATQGITTPDVPIEFKTLLYNQGHDIDDVLQHAP